MAINVSLFQTSLRKMQQFITQWLVKPAPLQLQVPQKMDIKILA
jgi:hypothetical protein